MLNQTEQTYQQRLKKLLHTLREIMRAEIATQPQPALNAAQLKVASRLEAERASSAKSKCAPTQIFAPQQIWLDDAFYIRLWNAGDLCAIKDVPQFYSAGRERNEPQGNAWLRALVIEFDEAYSGLVCELFRQIYFCRKINTRSIQYTVYVGGEVQK